MEPIICKNCGAEIKSGTYCTRCGTNHVPGGLTKGPQEQPASPPEQGIRTMAQTQKQSQEEMMIEASGPVADVGPLTWLLAIVVNWSFIVVIQIGALLFLLSNPLGLFDSFFSSSASINLKLLVPLIAVGAMIAVKTASYIESVYGADGNEALASLSRKIFKTSILVWAIYIFVQSVLPMLLMMMQYDSFTFEVLKILIQAYWEIIKYLWQYIILFFVYLGYIVGLINVDRDKRHILHALAGIGAVITVIFFFVK